MDDIRSQFGRTLRSLRVERGYSQEELAFRAGMSVPYLSDLERGRWNPSLAIIVDVAAALEVAPARLLDGVTADAQRPATQRRKPKD